MLTMMARAVEQISSHRRVQVEENTGHNNDLLLKTSLEEVQTVVDFLGEAFDVKPNVKCGFWDFLFNWLAVSMAL